MWHKIHQLFKQNFFTVFLVASATICLLLGGNVLANYGMDSSTDLLMERASYELLTEQSTTDTNNFRFNFSAVNNFDSSSLPSSGMTLLELFLLSFLLGILKPETEA